MKDAPRTHDFQKVTVRKTVITSGNKIFFPGTAYVSLADADEITKEERAARKVRPFQEETADGGLAVKRSGSSGLQEPLVGDQKGDQKGNDESGGKGGDT